MRGGWKAKRKRGAEEDAADEIVDEMHAAIDSCARAAEAELRQQVERRKSQFCLGKIMGH